MNKGHSKPTGCCSAKNGLNIVIFLEVWESFVTWQYVKNRRSSRHSGGSLVARVRCAWTKFRELSPS